MLLSTIKCYQFIIYPIGPKPNLNGQFSEGWMWHLEQVNHVCKCITFRTAHTQKSFRSLIKSNRNQIVFIMHRLIWNQTDIRLLFQINRKMVNRIRFRFDLIIFRKYILWTEVTRSGPSDIQLVPWYPKQT